MSQKTVCDGCGKLLCWSGVKDHVAVSGERQIENVGGGPWNNIPEDRFDWCLDCAAAAFDAVKDAQVVRVRHCHPADLPCNVMCPAYRGTVKRQRG
jgi:hypothetical protein